MGAVRNLWIRWKALKLPWRKTFLVGMQTFLFLELELLTLSFVLFAFLTLNRPRPIRQYLLGVQRQVKRTTTSSYRQVSKKHPIRRRPGLTTMAPMAEAYSARAAFNSRTTSRSCSAGTIEIPSTSCGREMGKQAFFSGQAKKSGPDCSTAEP